MDKYQTQYKSFVHPPSKPKKTNSFKTLEEIIDKFTWDLVINDPRLNFAPKIRVYQPWIEIKSKLGILFNKPMKE